MEGTIMQFPPGDPRLVDKIVYQLKSQGIFDRFRKECIADVDTKPAYQNLHQRVEGTVSAFLTNQEWRPELNKNQLRDSLRKHIHESGILDLGVERIVDQVVNPKILPVLLPQIEDVVYNFLGIEKPKKRYSQTVASLQSAKNFKPLKMETLEDLLPKDLDPISPGSVGVNSDDENGVDDVKNEVKEDPDVEDEKIGEEEESSPPFEPIEKLTVHDESSLDSHLSGISGLTSHDSQMSNLSFGKENHPLPEQSAPQKIPPVDLSNHDSQLSKVSSGSRLSIVFSDDLDKSDQRNSPFTSDMDIQNDDSEMSKSANLIETEPPVPQPPLPTEESSCGIDGEAMQEFPSEIPNTATSPVEPVPETFCTEEQDQVLQGPVERNSVNEDGTEIAKESDIDEKKMEGDKQLEQKDDRKRSSASTDSRDSRRSESTSHSSDSERRKNEKDRLHRSKEPSKHEERRRESKDRQKLEDRSEKDVEGNKVDDQEKLKKDIPEDKDRLKVKLENKNEPKVVDSIKDSDKIDSKEKLKEKEKNKSDGKVEKEILKDKQKNDEKEFKDRSKNDDADKGKTDKGQSKEASKEKTDKEKKTHHEEKGREKGKGDEKIEREGTRDKNEKEKPRHDERSRDAIREKVKNSEKDSSRDRVKSDEKGDKENHKEKSKTDERSKKDLSKDKLKYDKNDKDNRDSSRHRDQERNRSRSDVREKKEEKVKVDEKGKRNEKEVGKERIKKDAADGTKVEDEEEKRNKSQNDQKRDREKSSRDSTRHSDKGRPDKNKTDDKNKDLKSDSKENSSKHDYKVNDKSSNKDSKSKTRTESKEKDEKRDQKRDERSREKTKDDQSDKEKVKDKPRDERSDRDKSRSDKEKSKEDKNERDKSKDKEKERSSRSSHSGKDSDSSKKAERESSSKSRSSSTSGGSDKSRDSRKKEKDKSRSAVDDHSSHRDRNTDDRRSTDRDSNGAAHGQSASARDAHASRRHERAGADDGSSTSSKSEGGGGGGRGGNEPADSAADIRETHPDEAVAPSLPFKKRPVVSSPEPSDGVTPDEYDCVNNASGKLVLKIKKPKIAANIFEVRKIMHLRKSMAKIERQKQRSENQISYEGTDESSCDEPELKFFSEEEARPDLAFLKFVKDLENSESLRGLAASDEEEMPERNKAVKSDSSISGGVLSPPSTRASKADVSHGGKETTDRGHHTPSSREPSAKTETRGKPAPAVPERRERRRREWEPRTRSSAAPGYPTPVPPEATQPPAAPVVVSNYLPSHISAVLGIDSGLNVNISKARSPVAEEASSPKSVPSNPPPAPSQGASPAPSSASRGRAPKRRSTASPAPTTPDTVIPSKRLRGDATSESPKAIPGIVAVEVTEKTGEAVPPRIVYPPATSRPSTLGLRKMPTARSISSGIINYGPYISKEIVKVNVTDADVDNEEYSSSVKENNNVDKSSSDDEKGCNDDMSLSNEMISSALRDLMMESGLNLGESAATSVASPAAAAKDEAEGAAPGPVRRSSGLKAVRGRRLGLSRPTRRSGSGGTSPHAGSEFGLAKERDTPEAKGKIVRVMRPLR